ncbi:TonB-dependent receptor [Flavobacterium soyangense]|uniref:TonB-dependent receptor plug domain-containing protein n=1 Tax=Flavobacterium soyangense TaxID=2023265 RepID=A0A930U6A2_9FLAO|nr:TonB-dependent receptor [Flavobacterium soyangense]MBF2707678.1 TonB-dependent receptor plug domain-containing protein [Flavobacterium soyangense]
MKNFYSLIMFLFCFLAQSQIQKGIIKDSIGNPIENAYVINTNSQSHSHTNEFGSFSIDKTNKGDVLKISAIGFKKADFIFESNDFTIVLQEDVYSLDQVIIQPKLNAMNVISKIDLQTAPVNSSQEVLRKVPGLFIGQHAGGGKAEQLFLRGFDIDHGTDLAVSVDGMPVNMVSHAHGQGYADLHFVIPETIEKIDFGKGTYYANKGDFATAGYVSFITKEKINNNYISVEAGQFNTFKTVGLFNLLDKQKKQNAYFATEYIMTNGPFDSPQNFKRINLFGKYTSVLADNTKFSVNVSHFTSKWDASGQIPQRLIDAGLISRFGAVDNTEGGKTSRSNINISLVKPISESTFLKANAFYSNYNFELYSNFTFFLEDPINGDQIRQKESRNIFGLNTELNKKATNANFQLGFGLRNDATQNTELSHTAQRYTTLNTLKLGNIDQTNIFSYANAEFDFGKLKINPALRFDYFKFEYQDKLAANYSTKTVDKVKFSPKLNFIFTQNNNLQFYLKSGFGFHSNDTRVVVANEGKDPRALLEQAKQILPTAFGTDLGIIAKPFPKLILNGALWILNLQEELVYVGDAATVEISGRTKRMGADFGLRYQFTDYFFFDTDVNYTYARSIDAPKGQNYIPLAPDLTATAGLNSSKYNGFSGGFHFRYLKSRPANEDNSIVAKGYMVSDVNLNYEYKNVTFGFTAENVFNAKWNETQFATESRLKNESQSVEEIHFTPGTPFFLKAKIAYRF